MAAALSETELLALVDTLADGEWHSGETLAGGFGITRAALSKRIERLREWAIDVESRQGLGYRLAAALERLDADRLASAAPMQISVAAVVDSTNTRLLDSSADHDPQALLAEMQTAGRGRRGRDWVSPFGANLYLSIAWSWPAWPSELSALSLAVGVACANVLEAHGVTDVRLKWPNDLLVDDRKLGGILIEHRGEAGGACRVVIGLGLNLQMAAGQADAVTQAWINLDEARARHGLAPVGRNAFAAALLRELHGALQAFDRAGFSGVADNWARFDATRDTEVRILNGEHILVGVARGVDGSGALLVDAGDGRHRIHAGEVSLRRA
ncbi:bifunctional biotin--[acetyl-CoA-carboxylase] ligase/biotin operon repressor BirA [Solimonas terrae]|uniref:Bifunctional ligase/repressor BirA n=1 Tax=Solimonas terrae TaxID=1396819 RepID=A0A6M2BU87_9GAMM|nr:bifunctional biotin--[acetyl-CoA-carboxylase] ligase/biotin operon repressor BirA [Solimonas terrae]NGY05497.1 bifunctional biotin--[acetyl-CoA-carboxylase] ligase/biotin operon repressor BirA [Solimonas terrae]